MTTLKAGTLARLIQPVIQGTVIERRFGADDEIEICLEWTDADGNTVHRWFPASKLEAA